MKNVLLVHGYNGIPKIFNYFKEVLEKQGYNVIVPNFPTKTDITIDKYFNVFDEYKKYYNNELIVIAHSIGNPMFIKYVSKNNYNIGLYISLAGFAKSFINEGRDDLNNVIAPTDITLEEQVNFKNLVNSKYSIYSNNDHIVPFEILDKFPKTINSKPLLIENIGHMGSKSGLEELPQVVEIINNKI